MMEAMLGLFYTFIFVAGAAWGVAVLATLGTTFITAGAGRSAIGSGPGKLVEVVIPVAAGRRCSR